MNTNNYSKTIESLIENDIPNNLDLTPDILERVQNNKGAKMNKRTRALIPSTIVLVFMALIILTVPAVADTLQKWIGYIPGFGRVQDAEIRSLVEPMTQTVDGITVNVEELIASSDKTLVKYSISGYTVQNGIDETVCPEDTLEASLRLPDGNELRLLSAGSDSNFHYTAEFTSIPKDIDQVIFGREIQLSTEKGCSLWKFAIPLNIGVNAQNELMTFPIIDLATQNPENSNETNGDNSTSDSSMVANQVIPLNDGFIIQGTLQINTTKDLTANIFNGYLEDITLLDANNKILIPEMVPNDFQVEVDNNGGEIINWAFQIDSMDFSWPITITVNSVPMVTQRYQSSTILVDVGPNPTPGQKWEINKDVLIGTKTIHLISIERKHNDFGDGYEIACISDPSFLGSVNVVGENRLGGGGQGGSVEGEPEYFWSGFMGEVPTGILTLELNGQGVETINGPWKTVVEKPLN